MKNIVGRFLFTVLLWLNTLSGQTVWTQWSERIIVRTEYLYSSVHTTVPGNELTGQMLLLNGKIPLGKLVRFTVEVPFVWETYSTPLKGETKNDIGNFFIGCELGDLASPVVFELGVRPLVRQDLQFSGNIGYLADFDRGEIYLKELASYQIMLNIKSPLGESLTYRVRFGTTVWLPEKGTAVQFFDYGAKVGYDNTAMSIHAGVTGRLNLKEEHTKASFHHIGFDVGYHFDAVRPAFFYRIPLDKEINEFVQQTIGGSLSVEI